MILSEYQMIIDDIKASERLKAFWDNYRKEFLYAKDISYEEICNMVKKVMREIMT